MGSDWKTPLLVCIECFNEDRYDMETSLTYRLISANFGVVLDIPLDVLPPDDGVIVI